MRTRAAAACVALVGAAGCGGATNTATTGPAGRVVGDTVAAVMTPIEQRLRAGGYAIYVRGLYDPFPGNAVFVDGDWTTQHAFRFWVVPFPSVDDAKSWVARFGGNGQGGAVRVARAARVVYLGSTAQEFWGGKSETDALPTRDFRALLSLAEGR